jgi:uncharacterized protein YbgA (DUF1722 family)/uncharacterized protein YbbK (DUF523 family)
MSVAAIKETTINVGVSSCLLGEEVRFDSGHRKDDYIAQILGRYFTFIMICPEVEVGMGVPREAVHLEGDANKPRMVAPKSGIDWTRKMTRYSERRVAQIEKYNLSGYILKKDSPSCGMERVKVYGARGGAERTGRGLFARALTDHFPLLPVEEEGRLHDEFLRENFIVRVFAYHRLQNLFNGRYGRRDLIAFHTREKFLLMAHSPAHYMKLGRLVAAAKMYSPSKLRDEYRNVYMEALTRKATAKKNVNVLLHILGYLKKHLTAADKRDILDVIDDYHKGLIPLVVPITLLKHYLHKHRVKYVENQVYLNPSPKELMLRNHV